MSEINPITREEIFMAYAAGNTSLTLPKPITRREQFLNAIAQMVASGGATPEQIRSYVSAYLEENPVQAGATTEEAAQIRQNTEAIARKIDTPASAAVGQTIVVEAVDEEGKPVSWKTAELPTGGSYKLSEEDKREIADMVEVPDSGGNADQSGGSGSLNATASALLINILKNVSFYNADQTANITALEAALAMGGSSGGGGTDEPDTPVDPDEPVVTTYSVVSALLHATSNNAAASVEEGASYTATITAEEGYTLDGATVSVSMGGVDITETAYANGVVTIGSVTGNVIITVNAVSIAVSETLYKLSEPTVFDGTNAIDTGVALLANNTDWSICCKSEVHTQNSGNVVYVDYTAVSDSNNQFFVRNNSTNVSKIKWGVGTEVSMTQNVWAGQRAGNVFDFVLTHRADSDVVTWCCYAKNIDGKEERMNGTCTGINTSNPNNLKLGGYNGVTINDCVVYNRVISDDEINAYLGA